MTPAGRLEVDLEVEGRVRAAFDVDPGSVCAVIGPNGAGKTSLVRAIAGLAPATGHARLHGVDLLPKQRDLSHQQADVGLRVGDRLVGQVQPDRRVDHLPPLGDDLLGRGPFPCHPRVLQLAQSLTSGRTAQGAGHFLLMSMFLPFAATQFRGDPVAGFCERLLGRLKPVYLQ